MYVALTWVFVVIYSSTLPVGLQKPVNQLFKGSMYSVKKYLIWAFSFYFWQCTLKIENAVCSVYQIRTLITLVPSSSPFCFLIESCQLLCRVKSFRAGV